MDILRDERVVVVSGSYGAGHDVVADELVRRLAARGVVAGRLDVAAMFPLGLGYLLRGLYFRQLAVAPRSWASLLDRLDHDNPCADLVERLLWRLGRRLLRKVEHADLVVSTHPFASQILGHARAEGRLAARVVTYLTDASVHRLWVHAGVDQHLAIDEIAAAQARARGARAQAVDPVVPPTPSTHDGPRPWPDDTAVALVVGGSRGVGELLEAALDVLETGLCTPVVACGTNARLRRRLARIPGVVALGWRSDLARLMADADCVIQNAGGITSLEALAVGTPIVSYRPVPGHGVTNAQALDRAHRIPYVTSREGLASALRNALTPRTTLANLQLDATPTAPDAVEILLPGVDAVGSAA
ncbi:MAG TPA: glycosyltransferase [Nocardioides sp.]|jgi:UDP-N-acetylglucosamine:LPS N-acetylglucosamine transferase|uniref:MGDG synthase family glycosyltransferase n=1 Tax=Nocardioides sp. TaxID=35761 RepID=UPI002E31CC38|nr:glycosyltransferase [Nocardioides sp.]HEX3929874.1 glycosyltransferase [Nocardioides sp.]